MTYTISLRILNSIAQENAQFGNIQSQYLTRNYLYTNKKPSFDFKSKILISREIIYRKGRLVKGIEKACSTWSLLLAHISEARTDEFQARSAAAYFIFAIDRTFLRGPFGRTIDGPGTESIQDAGAGRIEILNWQ